jgi:hypothetical protein
MLLSVNIALRFSKGPGFLRPVPAGGFAPSSARTPKLPLDRLPKMKPLRPSGICTLSNNRWPCAYFGA